MKVKNAKVKIGSPPFQYTNSEEAAPEKLAYANKVGLGKIVKKSTEKTNDLVAGVAKKRVTRLTIKGKRKTTLKKI